MIRRWNAIVALSAALLLPSCGGGSGSEDGSGSQDTTPPIVQSTNPSSNATDVVLNTSITATFSEQVSAATPSSAFTLLQGSTPVAGSASFSGNTATFTPASPLGAHLTYTATLSTGVRDKAGNALASSYSWNFSTSDFSSITFLKQFDLGSAVQSGGFECLATDGTSIYLYTQVYLASKGTLHTINPQTGTITSSTDIPLVTLASTTAGGINFIADIAWHNGALWASGNYVNAAGTQTTQGVFKLNLTTGLAENAVPVASGETNEVEILQGLASDGTNLFAAIDRNYADATSDHILVKFNPTSVTEIPLSPAFLTSDGQNTRLDCGNGFLWVWLNPKFQKVNPTTGAVLATYNMEDGGSNLLYFSDAIWSINGTILRSYRLP